MISDYVVTVIGGANVDIQGKPQSQLLLADSNPGVIQSSLGGVGRNIAECISRLQVKARLITVVGDDKEGSMVKDNALSNHIDIQLSATSSEYRTSTYLYVLDEHGEMVVAISDMAITETLTPAFFKPLIPQIEQSPYTVIDANLPSQSIEYLAENLQATRLILDPVSVSKAIRAKSVLGKLYAIKLNRSEAEVLTGLTLDSPEKIAEAGQLLIANGVARVFITLGAEGVYYKDEEHGFFRQAIKSKVVNATGAGDSFTAAMVYGFVGQLSPQDLVDFCIGASTIALSDEQTIASDLSVDSVKTILSNPH